MVLVLKTSEGKTSVGSNPTLSATYRGIAQLVEQRSPKPRAVGSIPTAPANYFNNGV